MAAPTWQTSTTVTGAIGGTIVFNTPSGTTENDILEVGIGVESDLGITITPPSGWTSIAKAICTASAPDTFHERFWKRAAAGESGPYTFTLSGSDWREGYIVNIRGCKTSGSPVDAFSTNVSTAVQSGTTWASLTTTVADTLLVAGDYHIASVRATPPSGMTERIDVEEQYACTVTQAAAGSSGSKVGDYQGASTSHFAAVMVAYAPPPAAGYLPPNWLRRRGSLIERFLRHGSGPAGRRAA